MHLQESQVLNQNVPLFPCSFNLNRVMEAVTTGSSNN